MLHKFVAASVHYSTCDLTFPFFALKYVNISIQKYFVLTTMHRNVYFPRYAHVQSLLMCLLTNLERLENNILNYFVQAGDVVI